MSLHDKLAARLEANAVRPRQVDVYLRDLDEHVAVRKLSPTEQQRAMVYAAKKSHADEAAAGTEDGDGEWWLYVAFMRWGLIDPTTSQPALRSYDAVLDLLDVLTDRDRDDLDTAIKTLRELDADTVDEATADAERSVDAGKA